MNSVEEKATLRLLQKIPNVGPRFAQDLVNLGIHSVEELRGRDPDALYENLSRLTGSRQDPCVLDTFRAVVHYAETGEAKKWWEFTTIRKASK